MFTYLKLWVAVARHTFKLFRKVEVLIIRARILVQVTIYRRIRIGRDGHLDQSEAYEISYLVREYGPRYIAVFSFQEENEHDQICCLYVFMQIVHI